MPNPLPGVALIDTGATDTGVDESLLKQLGLNPIGFRHIGTPSSQRHRALLYPARITFPGTKLPQLNFSRVLALNLGGQGIHVLIGRDVLRFSVLAYDGLAGTFSIGMQAP